MPKMKSCKAISKRVKITARGKVKCYKIGRRHLATSKSAKTKRCLRRPWLVAGADVKKIKQALPYI